MSYISVTRFRVRSARFFPRLGLLTVRSLRELKQAPGFQTGVVLMDRHRAFWTMTAWESEDAMRHFITGEAHKQALHELLACCDEASVVHWHHPWRSLPSWSEADKRMRMSGHASRLTHPTPQHVTLTYAPPRRRAGAVFHHA